MTSGALADVGDAIPHSLRTAPVELRIEDRLQSLAAPVRRFSKVMGVVLVGSALVHIVLVVTTLVAGWDPPHMAQREITVDLVQDPPKPPPPPVKPPPPKAEAPKPTKPPEPPLELRKTEAPKPEAPKPPPPKVDQTKPTPPKPEPPKPELPKPALPKPAPAKPVADPPKSSGAAELDALKKQLESLKAEQSALQSELKSTSPTPDASAAASGKAVALPSIGSGDGDVVGYQELVFSQLAKAKGDEEYKGQAGVTGVRFQMDEEGRLTNVEVVTSSGNPTLDAKALDIVRRAAPFPPPPKDADRIVFANVNFMPPKH